MTILRCMKFGLCIFSVGHRPANPGAVWSYPDVATKFCVFRFPTSACFFQTSKYCRWMSLALSHEIFGQGISGL